MSNPRVSVIVPAWNAQATVEEAIRSVACQTVRDLEILVVDDGSADNTQKIARKLAENDSRIAVLTHPGERNLGVSASRNLALDNARGRYIGFLDADDAWLPDKLERQIPILESNDTVGMVFSDSWVCQTDDVSTSMAKQPLTLDPLRKRLSELFSELAGLTAETMFFDPQDYPFNWLPSPTPLVRRSLFESGLRFLGPPQLNVQFEDWAMWLMLSLRCEFVALSEPTTIYRVHSSQYTSRFSSQPPMQGVRGVGEVYRAVMEECAQEITARDWNERIRTRYQQFLCDRVGRMTLNHFPSLLSIAREWGCQGAVILALLRTRRDRVHWAIRNSFLFQPFRPLLRSLHKAIAQRSDQSAP